MNIAEFREFAFYGKDEQISASLMCGVREREYKINGYATDLVEFGVLTVTINDDSLERDDAKYVLFVGTKKFVGILQTNPYDGTLVADIKQIIDKNSNVSCVIELGEKDLSLKLSDVGKDWVIKSNDCLRFLARGYGEKLKTFIEKGEFKGEVYIKIMNDENDLVADFYYLISVYGRNGRSINIILSPTTGVVLASNSKI